jgi:hypothetical protein
MNWYTIIKIASKDGRVSGTAKALGMDEDFVAQLADLDPTPHGNYVAWIARQFRKSKKNPSPLQFPEDGPKVTERLAAFDKLTNSPKFNGHRDINKYKRFSDLAIAVDQNSDNKSKAQSARESVMKGHEVFSDDDRYQIHKITTPEASSEMCKGTDWCVKDPRAFARYEINDQDPLLMFSYDDKKIALLHAGSGQWMDVYDRPIGEDEAETINQLISDYPQGAQILKKFLDNGGSDQARGWDAKEFYGDDGDDDEDKASHEPITDFLSDIGENTIRSLGSTAKAEAAKMMKDGYFWFLTDMPPEMIDQDLWQNVANAFMSDSFDKDQIRRLERLLDLINGQSGPGFRNNKMIQEKLAPHANVAMPYIKNIASSLVDKVIVDMEKESTYYGDRKSFGSSYSRYSGSPIAQILSLSVKYPNVFDQTIMNNFAESAKKRVVEDAYRMLRSEDRGHSFEKYLDEYSELLGPELVAQLKQLPEQIYRKEDRYGYRSNNQDFNLSREEYFQPDPPREQAVQQPQPNNQQPVMASRQKKASSTMSLASDISNSGIFVNRRFAHGLSSGTNMFLEAQDGEVYEVRIEDVTYSLDHASKLPQQSSKSEIDNSRQILRQIKGLGIWRDAREDAAFGSDNAFLGTYEMDLDKYKITVRHVTQSEMQNYMIDYKAQAGMSDEEREPFPLKKKDPKVQWPPYYFNREGLPYPENYQGSSF